MRETDASAHYCTACGRNGDHADLSSGSDACEGCQEADREEARARRVFAPGPALERAIASHRRLYPRGVGR